MKIVSPLLMRFVKRGGALRPVSEPGLLVASIKGKAEERVALLEREGWVPLYRMDIFAAGVSLLEFSRYSGFSPVYAARVNDCLVVIPFSPERGEPTHYRTFCTKKELESFAAQLYKDALAYHEKEIKRALEEQRKAEARRDWKTVEEKREEVELLTRDYNELRRSKKATLILKPVVGTHGTRTTTLELELPTP